MKNMVRLYENSIKDTAWEFGLFEIMEEVRSWVMEEQGSIFPPLAVNRGNDCRANKGIYHGKNTFFPD
ncbi:MAG: hypothetical protein Q8O72_12895 [Bacteroidales bacterium]|jgi:hypothetical protein|nr:hypothetical protein [Bacteroidales bacterium]